MSAKISTGTESSVSRLSWLVIVPVVAIVALGSSALAEDVYPDGCVSCHVGTESGDHSAMRLDKLLASIGHGRGGARTLEIPNGCARCHAPDDEGTATSLGKIVHVIHFRDPGENPFLSKNGGDCSSCHRMDPETWEVTAKSGKRNW